MKIKKILRAKKIFFILIILVFLSSMIMSCGLFSEQKCGIEGEAEFRVGQETEEYCSISVQFRNSSVMFEDSSNILLVNFLGYDFDETATEKEKRQASALGVRERISMRYFDINSLLNNGEQIITDELLSKIIGTRQIMVQVPFDGTGIYDSEQIFMMVFQDDELVYRYAPSNTQDNLTFNLSRFSMSNLSEEEIEESVFQVASEDEQARVKRVNITARLFGSITIDEEQVNLNSDINFTTIVEMPENLLSSTQ